MKQEYHKTLKGQLHGVHEFGMSGLQMFCKDQELILRGPQWKAINHRLRKSANVRQKKTLLSSILVIVASYLIFPNKHL